MATVDTAALDKAMKIIYSDPLIKDIVTESELMDAFVADGSKIQTEQSTGGKYIETAHYVRWGGAAQSRAENDYIPVPENPRFENSRIFLTKCFAVVEMTGDTMNRVVNDEGSFINYMREALPDARDRVVQEMDRQYIGWGNGVMARITGTPVLGNGYIEIDDAFGVAGFEDPWLQFTEGARIVFSTAANGNPLRNPGSTQSALITAIDESTTPNRLYITADAALWGVIDDDDYIFPGDAAGTAAPNGTRPRELTGLLGSVDDGGIVQVYNNIDRADPAMRFWVSRVRDVSGAPPGGTSGLVTEELLFAEDAKVSTISGQKIDMVVMSVHGPIGYWKDLKNDRTFNDPRSYTGGTGTPLHVSLGDRTIPLRTARKLPPQVAFLLNTKSFRRITLQQWEWEDLTGSIWKLVTDAVGRRHAYFAFGYMYEQLACIKPRCNLRIEGLIRHFDY